EARELAAEPAHDVDGGIAGIADAEDELKARIVLSTEAPERLVEPGLHTAEGLQHTDRWRKGRVGGTAAPEDASTVRRPRPVPRRNERERDEDIAHECHDLAPVSTARIDWE